ncbi:uncharacterized protein VP01_3756g2 [Puccinia sorghi]|uniref:Superoxide dismutase copper/zinc binding domain-containing protein n=1 Tax=Puccinia sorghi TaxID=27349 RepID=A0A0L6UVR0_9BASI|nr:uncharacterized protein VP01_3756g2 [Puccinia sorghi]
MSNLMSPCIFWSLLFLGLAASFQVVNSEQLHSKNSKATQGAVAHVSGKQDVIGTFQFSSSEESDWVNIVISMRGLLQYNLTEGFAFHIHEHPVVDNNCSSTLGHFHILNTKPSCTSQVPNYCQPGELSARHGNLPGLVDVFTERYNDNALELTGANSIIGRSIVIHGANMSRIACGSIESWIPGSQVTSRFSSNPFVGWASKMWSKALMRNHA